MNRLDVPAAVVRPADQRHRSRRDRWIGDLVPVLIVAATVVIAVGTAPHTPHIADALIHPMALTNQKATDTEPSDRVPVHVEVPDLRGMTFELDRETALRAGLDVVPPVNHVPTSDPRQADHVIAQDPSPLTAAERGTAVQLSLGRGSPRTCSSTTGLRRRRMPTSTALGAPWPEHRGSSSGTTCGSSAWTAADQTSYLVNDQTAALRGWVSANDAFPTAPPSGCALPLPAQPGADPSPIA